MALGTRIGISSMYAYDVCMSKTSLNQRAWRKLNIDELYQKGDLWFNKQLSPHPQ